MSNFKWLILGLVFFISSNLFAASTLPASLMYNNKPIDALCIYEATKNTELSKCGVNAVTGREIDGSNASMLAKGYTGFNYKQNNMGPTHGESYYRVLCKQGKSDIIYTIDSSGGSGDFTAIKLLTRNKNTITVKTLDAGDRCNGGINNVLVNNHVLMYRVNITPWDFLAMNNDNPLQLRAYDDLAACAACCAGTATYYRNYTLSADFVPPKPYQRCFDKVIGGYIAKHKTILSAKEFREFTEFFNQTCHLQ
jgi:hypothetical protein